MKHIFCFFILLFSVRLWAQDTRWIDMEWDAVTDAKEYELELFQDENGEQFSRGKYKTDSPKFSHSVAPGKYSLRVRSIDDRGVPGEWSDSIPLKVKIVSPLLLRPLADDKITDSMVAFEWNQVVGATSYQLVIRNAKKAIIHDSNNPLTKDSVYLKDLGKYSWAVFAIGDGDETRSPKTWTENAFRSFERVGGELSAPDLKVSMKEKVSILWNKIENAKAYEIDFFPPAGSEAKNRRFKLKEPRLVFSQDKLKMGTTTITIRAVAPAYQDSPKSIVKIAKGSDGVASQEVINGQSDALKKPLDEMFWKNQYFFSLPLARYNYASRNHDTDTQLKQSDLTGIGFNVEWYHQVKPTSRQHKTELSVLKLSSGDASGLQTRAAYTYIFPFKSQTKLWSLGGGASFLKLPAFFGDRSKDEVSSISSSSLGPEFYLGLTDPLTQDWHLHANLVYAYHPVLLSSGRDADPFGWLRVQIRFLRYTSLETAYFIGGEFQRWNQSFEGDESKLSGWSLVGGVKKGF